MLRVALKILLAGAALAAVWAFVPMGGRTLADRWHRARTPAEFVDRAWADAFGEQAGRESHALSRAQGRAGAPGVRPSESHSEADRKALDRILSKHL